MLKFLNRGFLRVIKLTKAEKNLPLPPEDYRLYVNFYTGLSGTCEKKYFKRCVIGICVFIEAILGIIAGVLLALFTKKADGITYGKLDEAGVIMNSVFFHYMLLRHRLA